MGASKAKTMKSGGNTFPANSYTGSAAVTNTMTVKNPLRRAAPKVRRFHGRSMANSLSTRNSQAHSLPAFWQCATAKGDALS